MKKCRGSMTITMCLIFSILLSLLLSDIQLALTQAGRIQAMHAADTGIYSIFAQYDKDLLDSYDLFYLDAGYGSTDRVMPSAGGRTYKQKMGFRYQSRHADDPPASV